jgi:cytochrome c553
MKTPSQSFTHLGLMALSFLILSGAHAQTAGTPNVQAKVAMCIGCHGIVGYQASFPEVHKVPKISGQNAKYIASALTAYRKGDRKHPSMKGVAAPLSDADIQEIAAFYEASGKGMAAEPAKGKGITPPEVQALLTKGNCAACHGEGLNKPIDGSYPKLAGQHADYLYVALKAYQTDANPQIGRNNAIMGAQSKMFNHAELKVLANYIGGLPGDLKTVPQGKFR